MVPYPGPADQRSHALSRITGTVAGVLIFRRASVSYYFPVFVTLILLPAPFFLPLFFFAFASVITPFPTLTTILRLRIRLGIRSI